MLTSRGALQRVLTRAYKRLGARYPGAAVTGQLQLVYPVVLFNLGMLALYVEMSATEFLRLMATSFGGFFVYNLLYARVARRRLEPVRAWVAGARGREETVSAWTACASFPREMMRCEWTGHLGVYGYGGLSLWSVYVTWELGYPAYTAAPLIAGVAVFVLYTQALRFFVLEQVVRPPLQDIAREAADETGLHAPGLALRTRLLVALPALNVITAVAVAGVFQDGDQLATLGLAVLIAIAVAGSIAFVLTSLLTDSVTAPIAALRKATEQVGQGDFSARVPIVTTDETGALARSFNEMAAGLAERERIREAFGTYVDREVAEHILREGTSLAGEEVEVTMMFIDIRNFTGFAERASAPEVVATINRLFERAVPVIHAHGGHVDKFVGDGLLAVFGAPRRQENHADEALAAALEIERAVDEEFEGELAIGVGLNSGVVVAGNVGGAGRLEFSVIGDAVNVAARVESATRQTGDTILVSEQTHGLLRDPPVGLVERPGISLKGKSEAVSLYAPQCDEARPLAS